jgi:hypothetical protein
LEVDASNRRVDFNYDTSLATGGGTSQFVECIFGCCNQVATLGFATGSNGRRGTPRILRHIEILCGQRARCKAYTISVRFEAPALLPAAVLVVLAGEGKMG